MNLLGRGNNPKFWSDEVRNKDCFVDFRNLVLGDWKTRCENKQIEAFKYSEFAMFGINGNRSVYQESYFNRRKMLNCSALLSLIYPEEEKYFVFLEDLIFATCNEYTWALPAHQPDLLTKSNKCHLDLFACETGFTLAQIYTMLGNRLSPLIKNMIETEIEYRIISPYLENKDDNKKLWWISCEMNWAAVCAGSIGCTVMLMRPDLFNNLCSSINKTIQCYLNGF